MSTKVETVIAATALIVLFHYGLTPGNQPIRWIDLATIPGISIFFLYIKNQIMASRMQAHHLQRSERHLATAQARSETIEQFISTFLLPKLEGLLQLGSVQETGKRTIVNQIDLLRSEAEKILIDRENTKN